MVNSYIFGLVFVIGFGQIFASDECRARSPCSCVYDDGTGYDLSRLATGKQNYLQSLPLGNQYYIFHPCVDVTNLPDNQTSVDKYSLGVYNTNTSNVTILGHASHSFIKITSETKLHLIYKQEKNISTVRLVCVNINEDHLYPYPDKTDDDNNEKHDADLILYSRHACRVTLETGLSGAAIFFIILWILAFSYLFIGIALKYYLVGARGIEVIPNISFWRRLPTTIWNGIAFVRNGCRSQSENLIQSPNQDSYISI